MRRFIGVLIDTMDGEYQRTVTEHLIRAALSRDVKLLFFGGSALESSDLDRVHNRTIFDLANTSILDGVIIVPSTMMHRYEETDLLGILAHLKHAPVVSIGMTIEGAHSIHIDNKAATKAVFEHMMSHYKLEEICYVSGPMKNYEAKMRFEAWLELLEENDLAFDGKRHYEGDFFTADGSKAVDQYIEDFGRVPKAIVAANDEMAIGVYTRLSQLGYHIPEDVGIAGFDNVESTSDFFPPITTYDQCIDLICEKALQAIDLLIEEKMVVGEDITEGHLVVRESCGCLQLPSKVIRRGQQSNWGTCGDCTSEIERIEVVLYRGIGEVISPIIRRDVLPSDPNGKNVKIFSQSLVASLIEDIKADVMNNKFNRCLNNLISFSVATEGKQTNLLHFYEQTEKYFLGLTDNVQLLEKIDSILYKGTSVINAGLRRREENYQYNFRQMYMMSRCVVREFNGVNCNEDIFRILKQSLPHYGISSCYMVVYESPMEFDGIGQFIYPMMSELVFNYQEGLVSKGEKFMTNKMLPSKGLYKDDPSKLLFLSLDVGRTQYGYIVFSMDGIDYTIYETIRSQVSEAMKRHQLNLKRLEAEWALNKVLRELEASNDLLQHQSVHDDLTGLYNRRGFYTYAERYFNGSEETEEELGLIFADIDGLKAINDTYGHDEGDFAIKYVAKTLKEIFSIKAIVGRMSGDEFTALLVGENDLEVIDDYIKAVNKKLNDFNQSAFKPFDLSISMGYAPSEIEGSHSLDALLLKADQHMYRVKDRKKRVLNTEVPSI